MDQLSVQKFFLLFLTINSLFINGAFGIKKVWIGSNSYKSIKSWQNEIVPSGDCPNQVIKFPLKLYTSVPLEENIAASQIILSEDGGLLLGSDTTISLSDAASASNCEHTEIVFTKPEPAQWFSPYNWRPIFGKDEERYNKATPDTHWIPCENDIAIFPNDSTILVDVNFAPYVNFQAVQINGRTFGEEFQEFMRTELGSSMFLNAFATTVNAGKCSEGRNCVCEHQEFLCMNVDCDKKGAFCVDPIMPSGFCCNICGAYISFEVTETFDMKTFMRSIEQTLSFSKFDKESVEYFATFTSKDFVQLVVVDKVDGNDMSGTVMNYLRQNLIEKMFKHSKKIYGQSGTSYPPGTSSGFTLIFFTLFIVIAFLGAFYMYHYEDRAIPRLFAMIRTRQFPTSQFIFARFDNQRREEDGMVDIDVVPEADEDEEEEEVPSSFNNPLYEGKLNLNEASEQLDDASPNTAEETELKATEKVMDTPKIEVTTFDEVDLMGPNEE